MWVDDEVRHNAILGPRHVLLVVGDANGALLPMPTGKLVTHLRYPDGPHLPSQAMHTSAALRKCFSGHKLRLCTLGVWPSVGLDRVS